MRIFYTDHTKPHKTRENVAPKSKSVNMSVRPGNGRRNRNEAGGYATTAGRYSRVAACLDFRTKCIIINMQ